MLVPTQYLNEKLCADCGGKCCCRLGGAALPDDIIRNFSPPLETAVALALQSGIWVVDHWEGDPRGLDYDDPDHISRGYYLRPRSEGDRDKLFCASWGGKCLLLTPTGCKLTPEMRPATCRLLEPKEDGKCALHGGGKKAAAMSWLDYHNLILSAAEGAR